MKPGNIDVNFHHTTVLGVCLKTFHNTDPGVVLQSFKMMQRYTKYLFLLNIYAYQKFLAQRYATKILNIHSSMLGPANWYKIRVWQ